MTSTCPNCQQPVRMGAKYCGFCGTILTATGVVESAPPFTLQEHAGNDALTPNKKMKAVGSSPGKTNQVVTTIAIILLFLVIMLSIAIRHWSYVSVWLSQLLP